MGASPLSTLRRTWLLLLPALLLIPIAGGRAALGQSSGPTSERQESVPQIVQADRKLFLPMLSVPRPPQVELQPFATGFNSDTITDIAHAGDGRLFVVLRQGIVQIVYPDGRIEPTPFLDISGDVATHNWEAGLLGLAFHPDFPNTPYVFLTYTDMQYLNVARMSLKPGNPNQVDPGSKRPLIGIKKSPTGGGFSPVHNGGDLAFGPDGYLYIPTGDGGPDPYEPNGVPGDPYNNAQRGDRLLGKILRIDVDPTRGLKPDCGSKANYYSIPRDNPFVGTAACDEIWASGLRNPWRMSFDRLTGDLYIGDVGEWRYEEINVVPAGAGAGYNFGWHCYEGTYNYAANIPQFAGQCGPATNYVTPTHQYDHSNDGCSVIGGFVYRGRLYPAFQAYYLFADFCTGELWAMSRNTAGRLQVGMAGITSLPYSTFGEDVNGELYAGGWGKSPLTLYRVVLR